MMQTYKPLPQQYRKTALALMTILACGLSGATRGDDSLLQAAMGNAGSNTSDITIMQKIRQDVTADKTLSPSAQNVIVLARNGDVTLQGDVSSAPERDAVVSKAQNVAGTKNIINQITIAGKSDSDNAVLPYNPAR